MDEIIEQLSELIAEVREVLERETPLAVEHGGKGLSDAE